MDSGNRDRTARNTNSQSGFTLIELITVIIIISVVTTVAIARIPSISTYTRRMETDTLKGHMRYAQNKAMNTNPDDDILWGIDFITASGYRLYSRIRSSATMDYKYFPALESASTVTMTVLKMKPGVTVWFDTMGSPGSSDISVKTEDNNQLFIVTAETGFIR